MNNLSIVFFVVLAIFGSQAFAKIYNSPLSIPDPTKMDGTYISNPDGILSKQEAEVLQNMVKAREQNTADEIAIVVVEGVEGWTPKEFAHDLFNLWGVGKKGLSNGLLILVAKNNRRVEFETGYGLEGDLPDVVCKRIQEKYMVPLFKKAEYFLAIKAGLEQTIIAIDGSRNLNPTLKYVNSKISFQNSENFLWLALAILILLTWLASISKANSIGRFIVSLGSCFLVYMSIFHYNRLEANAWFMVFTLINFVVFSVWKQQLNKKIVGLTNRGSIIDKLAESTPHTFLFVFFPIAWLCLLLSLNRKRNETRNLSVICEKCGSQCTRYYGPDDIKLLTLEDVKESSLGSVEYDIWKCEKCDYNKLYSITKLDPKHSRCPKCSRRAFKLGSKTTIRNASTTETGKVEFLYSCALCLAEKIETISIPKISQDSNGGGSGSGGGGGSFGGGSSGGGGSESSW